ncbi:MAG: hypothetical protein E7162_06635 [Firmicutes bacterium]|nr:hypothetical protein [Bacillota bacterium]
MNKNKKVKKQIEAKSKLELNTRMFINILLISLLLLGAIYTFVMANAIDVENKELLISYNAETDVNYSVILKQNPYYPTSTLGMNQQYPSALVDKVKVEMDYRFVTSENTSYKYRYFATATLIANSKNNGINKTNNNLLTKTYQLENTVTGNKENTKEFILNKEYQIDYNYFNNYINNYKNAYALSLDSYIKVTMYVELIDNYNEEVINATKTMEVNIPLLTNPFSITVVNPENTNKSLYIETNDITSSTFFNVIASMMLLTGLLLAIQEFRKVIKSDKQQSKYINKLNKIINANSEVIVKVKNKINLNNHNIIEVETIETLLDAQNELRIPIAYFELKRNKEGCFVIVNGKEAWRYILRVEDDK